MEVRVRATATLAVGLLMATPLRHADAASTKIGVDHRQSGLDAAFVPDRPRSDLDRFRVHLGLDLATWVRQTPWPRSSPGATGPSDDLAFPGYRRAGFGFGIAHGFADAVVVGLRIDYEATWGLHRTPQPAEHAPRSLGLSAMPYVEIMMVRQGPVRPFVMVRSGIGGSTITTDSSSPLQSSVGGTLSLLYPTLGAGLGAHAFVTPEISIDSSVTVDHRWEYARQSGPAPDPAAVAMGDESVAGRGRHDAFGRRLSTSLVFSVSRWF